MKYFSLIISVLCLLIGIIILLNPTTQIRDSSQNNDGLLLFIISSIFFVGFLIAYYLDNLKKYLTDNKKVSSDNFTAQPATKKWKCPKCSRLNDASTFECEHCGFRLT